MIKSSLVLIAGLALGSSAFAGAADAQSRIRGQYFDPLTQAPPVTVRGRPFTDSGTSVPTGYSNEYMTDQTTLNQPVYSSFNPDAFGQDVLPHRFDGLGLN